MKFTCSLKSVVWPWIGCVLMGTACAQTTPLGLWRTVDEKTGQARGVVEIHQREGKLVGTLVRSLIPASSNEISTCKPCTDDRRNQPLAGMEIIRGAQVFSGADWSEGGEILDPDTGKIYALKMRVSEDGQALWVRGYIGPFYRTQTWERAQ